MRYPARVTTVAHVERVIVFVTIQTWGCVVNFREIVLLHVHQLGRHHLNTLVVAKHHVLSGAMSPNTSANKIVAMPRVDQTAGAAPITFVIKSINSLHDIT